jgi:hypothetical protein
MIATRFPSREKGRQAFPEVWGVLKLPSKGRIVATLAFPITQIKSGIHSPLAGESASNGRIRCANLTCRSSIP